MFTYSQNVLEGSISKKMKANERKRGQKVLEQAKITGYGWKCGHCPGQVTYNKESMPQAIEALENHERGKRHIERHPLSGAFPHDKSGRPTYRR